MATSILGSEKSSRPITDFEFVTDSKDRPSRLGKGSFASVRLVQEKKTGKLFALKMINVNSSKISKSDLHNLRTEIQIHRQLDHPNIIKFNSYIQDGLNVYLVLDYAQNGNLYNYLHKKKILTPNEIFHFFYQTCLAVQYLHQKDFLHRDIKPENLLLDKDHNIKLCDFGWSAKSIKEKRITFCGTYEYMAPEIVRKKPYDYRVDIWSLGVLLYELVHREAPYKGRNLAEIINSLSKHTLTFSSCTQPEVKDLIEQILKIDPNERISISEILNHPWIKYHLSKRDYIQQNPNKFLTPTKPVYNQSLTSEPDTYISQDLIPPQEQLDDNLLSYQSGVQSQTKPVRNLKIALNIQVPTLTVNCTRLGEGNSLIQTTPRGVNQISSPVPKVPRENECQTTPRGAPQVMQFSSPVPSKVTREFECEETPVSTNAENFYSNKGHSHSSSTLNKKLEKWVFDARKLSNDSGSRKVFEKDIMSPDFNIKLHSILGQLNVNPPTRREGSSGASVLTSRCDNTQQKSLNHITSTSFRGNEMPTARDNSIVRQMDQKENPHNATGDLSNLSLDNFKVKYSSDSKATSRPVSNYMTNTPVQARGDPLQNLHIPTFKINFTSTKYKPDTAKSTPQKYFVFNSNNNTSQKSNEVNISKFSANNSAYDAMVSSLCKTTRAEEKPAYEGYLIQSSSLTDLQKKLLFKLPESSRGPPPSAEKVLNRNKENRMETTRDNRVPLTYDKLYSQR